jgi:hypothetical protein
MPARTIKSLIGEINSEDVEGGCLGLPSRRSRDAYLRINE